MGIFDRDRAEKAYNEKPVGNLNEMLSANHFTKFDEFKVSDHRISYELTRIADSLEKIANK